MKNYSPTNPSTILIAAFFLVSCGADNPLERPTEASGTMTAQTAALFASEFASDFDDYIENAVDGGEARSTAGDALDGETRSQLAHRSLRSNLKEPGVVPNTVTGCEPTASGDSTDSDADLIPVNQTQRVDCSTSLLGVAIELKGTIKAQDKDDTNDHGGFIFSIDDFLLSYSGNGQTISTLINMYAEGTKNETSHTARFDYAVQATQAAQTLNVGVFLDTTVTPTNMSDPENTGSIDNFSGFFKVAGVLEDTEVDFVIAVSSTDLTYDKTTCTSGRLKNGVITLTDGSANKLEVIYTNCTPSYEFNDAAITPTRDIKQTKI